jgi:adenylate cyclase
MAKEMTYSNTAPIIIDLDQFKLHLNIQGTRQLSLHFDTSSRRFYLSVIALVVEQMQKSDNLGSVPLEDHTGVLTLLNETVGGSAGSSKIEKLLPRIYKKWKDALPDLENASLFKVIGAKKGYSDSSVKIYRFDTKTKDMWANLFEYKGSLQKVRLRFSVERLGIRPEDVLIAYGNQSDTHETRAWDRFIERLRENLEDKHVTRTIHERSVNSPDFVEGTEEGGGLKTTVSPRDPMENRSTVGNQASADPVISDPSMPIRDREVVTVSTKVSSDQKAQVKRRKWFGLMLISSLFLLMAAVALWKFYPHPTFQTDSMKSEIPVSPEASSEASIAVLPFANISGDPKEDYLSDGITEQIITALSKTPKMLVIARNSVFTYKGKPVIVQQVSEELGVRYVLEGSVQKSGDRLRVTAQLIDAKTGNHLWSGCYDRELKDLFAIQDEITMKIIEGLRVNLTEGEQGLIYSTGTENLEAYLKALKAGELILFHRSKDDNALGRQMLEEAIAFDAGYVNAYVLLAWSHLHDGLYGWTKTPKKSLERGLKIGQEAVSLNESSPDAHSVVGAAYRKLGMLDEALAAGERAIALAPNGAEINALHSANLLRAGRNEEALARINKAIHLNPISPMWYFTVQGFCYRNTGQYEEAVKSFKKALLLQPKYASTILGLGMVYSMMGQNEEAIKTFKKLLQVNPSSHRAHIQLAISYSLTGQEEKAHAEAKEVLRVNPKFSVEGFAKSYLKGLQKDQKDATINALRKAGLK